MSSSCRDMQIPQRKQNKTHFAKSLTRLRTRHLQVNAEYRPLSNHWQHALPMHVVKSTPNECDALSRASYYLSHCQTGHPGQTEKKNLAILKYHRKNGDSSSRIACKPCQCEPSPVIK